MFYKKSNLNSVKSYIDQDFGAKHGLMQDVTGMGDDNPSSSLQNIFINSTDVLEKQPLSTREFTKSMNEEASKTRAGKTRDYNGNHIRTYDYDLSSRGFNGIIDDYKKDNGIGNEDRITIGNPNEITSIRSMDFNGVDFSKIDFVNVRFTGCNFNECNFDGTNVDNDVFLDEKGRGAELFWRSTISNSEVNITAAREDTVFDSSVTVVNSNLSDKNREEVGDRKFTIELDLSKKERAVVNSLLDNFQEVTGEKISRTTGKKESPKSDSSLFSEAYRRSNDIVDNPDLNGDGVISEVELALQSTASEFLEKNGDLTKHDIKVSDYEVPNNKREYGSGTIKLPDAINNTELGGGCMTKDVCK